MVEALDRLFESVCELDLVFHFDQVHFIVDEIIQGGLVIETNVNQIVNNVNEQTLRRKKSQEAPLIPNSSWFSRLKKT
ncbi:AP-3 complex subunit sigma [Wallemia ichthyophaga EXF-994]|nr:AP-3 complex subunit sigma [Wallemia ichthyophaga EXF-994]EOR01662.1 AP-3 complex subunit sigma [Wallemia ichthyophaga EXF-994]